MLQVLEAYAVFGSGAPSKEAHKESWDTIIGLGDELPSHIDLDAMLEAAGSEDDGGQLEGLVQVHAIAEKRVRKRATRKTTQAASAGNADELLDGLGDER